MLTLAVMPTLNWIGKEAVVNHHHHVPFHLLKDVSELAVGDPASGDLIVQDDNSKFLFVMPEGKNLETICGKIGQ